MNLGTLVLNEDKVHDEQHAQHLPSGYDAITAAAEDTQLDPIEIGKQAAAAQKDDPAIWFVNFPSKDASTEGSKELKAYQDDVLTYRCWASGVWWTNVLKVMSKQSLSKQSSYAAKVAITHMKMTPW